MKNTLTLNRNQLSVMFATIISAVIFGFTSVNAGAAGQSHFNSRHDTSPRTQTRELSNQAVIEEAAGAQRQQNMQNYRSAQEHRIHRNDKVGDLISMEHNGKTIYVSEHAVKALLEHGDSITQ